MDELTITFVRSGGQTGVDRAALDSAIERGVPHGGWCPAGRRAEDGPIPARYRLDETDCPEYAERTRLNVQAADGTLILAAQDLSGGTRLTFDFAVSVGKPVFVVRPNRPWPEPSARAWLRTNRIRHLNVAGPRGSSDPHIYADARRFMDRLLARFGDAPDYRS